MAASPADLPASATDAPEELVENPGDTVELGELDLTSEVVSFAGVDGHIQENLEDEIVREALDKVMILNTLFQKARTGLEGEGSEVRVISCRPTILGT